MPLTIQEVKTRADRIGASDVAVIVMGDAYPWRSNRNGKTLWLDKMGQLKPWDGNAATDAGNLLEPSFRMYAEREIGPLTTAAAATRSSVPRQVEHPNGVMVATLDGRFVQAPWLAEFKSVGQTNMFWTRERWGKPGQVVKSVADCSHVAEFDEDGQPEFGDGIIPAEYYWQTQAQLACANAYLRKRANDAGFELDPEKLFQGVYLVANLPGTSYPFRYFIVERNDEEIAVMENAVCEWWDQWVIADTEPNCVLTPYTMGQLILGEGEEPGTAPTELFQQVLALKAQKSPLDKQANALDKQIKALEAQLVDAGGRRRLIRSPAGHECKITVVHVKASDAYQYDRKFYKAPKAPTPETIHG